MTQYLRQGSLRFAPGYKLQTRWGRTEAAVFTLECAGAPLAAAAAGFGGPRTPLVLGLAMVAAAIALLLWHLGHPRRAWLAMTNLRHSWISRGTVALGAFAAAGLLFLVLDLQSAPGESPATMAGLRWVLGLLAIFIAMYPGLVLSASPAIPLWSSGLLPVLSLLQGASGAALAALALGAGFGAPAAAGLLWVALSLLGALAVALALYLGTMLRRGGAGAESARYMLRRQPFLFLLAGCAIGIALPLALLAWAMMGAGSSAAGAIATAGGPTGLAEIATPLLGAAALARLGGDFALRTALLEAAMFDSVV
ncbi:MAG: dimethyl sulfoxide reductase anchor subunit [Burkholderiales bacterium]|nr:MAG: dimethyl sulfoxide reductase anchor subunit [Burkholderiales bacterium]